MKKLSISLFFIVSVLILVFQQTEVFTNILQAPAVTGAPSEGTCATTAGCHLNADEIGVTANNRRLQLTQFSGSSLSNGYTGEEGTTVNLTVAFNQNLGSNYPVYGFSMTALFEDGTPAGTFTSNQSKVNILSANGRSYAGHKNADGTSTWLVQYELPATISQDIIFYIAGNGANGNGAADPGDDIYLAEYRLSDSDFGIQDVVLSAPQNAANVSEINIFPNPVQTDINMQFKLNKGGHARAEIVDLKGATVAPLFQETLNPGDYNRKFSLNKELNSGMYLVRIEMEGNTYFQKIMVQ